MGEVFFENLRGLLSRQDSQETADCLEVYCICLLLGYRGRYALGGGGEIETFIRQIREKMGRFRGQLLFLRAGAPPPEVKRSQRRLTAGAGDWASPRFACCWQCCWPLAVSGWL